MKTDHREAIGRAFCSTANLGAGFDVFGLALDKYSDLVRVRTVQERKIRLIIHGRQTGSLPREAKKNSAGPPAAELLRMAHSRKGLVISIEKNVPQGLGLGSSGATAAACTKSLNHLLNLNLSDDELVRVASLGEKAVAGTAHADNVAASLLGGFVVVYDNPVRAFSIKPPKRLAVVVVTPQLATQRNKTRKARSLVPRKVGTNKAILNVGRASAIVAGFALGNVATIGRGMEDEIAEPFRRNLIPGYQDVKKMALGAGASGVSISGAGPSLVSLVDRDRRDPRRIAHAMVGGFDRNRVRSTWFVARPAPGATIVKSR